MFLPDTLAAARRDFWQQIETKEGGVCPCCDRYGKIQPTPFGIAQAKGLMFFYKHGPGYVEAQRIGNRAMLRANSHAKAKHWGMLEEKPNDDDPSKNRLGVWKITERGVAFLRGVITIPSHAMLYNRQCFGFSDTPITIHDALGVAFDFAEWKRLGMEDFNP